MVNQLIIQSINPAIQANNQSTLEPKLSRRNHISYTQTNQLPEAVKGSMTLYAFKNSYDEHRNAAMDLEE